MNDDDVVEVSVHVAAQPEIVFPYFTAPGRYVQWMGGDATLEPVPGGCYRVRMRDGVEAAGEFVEVDPPHRLVFTWGWTHDRAVPPGATHVVVTLHAENGGTPRRAAPPRPVRPGAARPPPQGMGALSRQAQPPDRGRRSRPGPERLTRGRHRPPIAAGISVFRST